MFIYPSGWQYLSLPPSPPPSSPPPLPPFFSFLSFLPSPAGFPRETQKWWAAWSWHLSWWWWRKGKDGICGEPQGSPDGEKCAWAARAKCKSLLVGKRAWRCCYDHLAGGSHHPFQMWVRVAHRTCGRGCSRLRVASVCLWGMRFPWGLSYPMEKEKNRRRSVPQNLHLRVTA